MNALLKPPMVPGPGFADPVRQAQCCFRTLLEAMSRPGRVMPLPADALPGVAASGPGPVMTALLLTLLDAEVDLWLGPDWDTRAVREHLRFHTGVRRATDRASARFVALDAAHAGTSLWERVSLGSDECPENGATVLIGVPRLQALDAPMPGSLCCQGPGIRAEHRLLVPGLGPGFWGARADLAARLPRGAELILCDDRAVAAFPRTTRVTRQD